MEFHDRESRLVGIAIATLFAILFANQLAYTGSGIGKLLATTAILVLIGVAIRSYLAPIVIMDKVVKIRKLMYTTNLPIEDVKECVVGKIRARPWTTFYLVTHSGTVIPVDRLAPPNRLTRPNNRRAEELAAAVTAELQRRT